MKRLVTLIKFLIIGTTFVGCNKIINGEVKVVPGEDVQTLLQLENIQLIDVRTPKEYKEGYIENAQNINFLGPTFTEDIKKLNKQEPLIVYCRSGKRSAKSIKKLLEAGFTEIYDLEGGIIKWKQEGFKININR